MKVDLALRAIFDPINVTISRKREDRVVYMVIDGHLELILSTENTIRLRDVLNDVLKIRMYAQVYKNVY